MADEFNGCECLWSHEMAMRRLLSLLRQRQSHCTDTDCIVPSLGDRNATSIDGMSSGNFLLMSMILMFAVIFYMIRSNTMRRNTMDKQRPPTADREGPPGGGNNSPSTIG